MQSPSTSHPVTTYITVRIVIHSFPAPTIAGKAKSEVRVHGGVWSAAAIRWKEQTSASSVCSCDAHHTCVAVAGAFRATGVGLCCMRRGGAARKVRTSRLQCVGDDASHGCTSSSSASERNFSPAPPSFAALPGLLGLGLADGGESTVTSALVQHGVLRCSWCAVLQHALLCCNMMCCVAACPAVLQHAPLHCKR